MIRRKYYCLVSSSIILGGANAPLSLTAGELEAAFPNANAVKICMKNTVSDLDAQRAAGNLSVVQKKAIVLKISKCFPENAWISKYSELDKINASAVFRLIQSDMSEETYNTLRKQFLFDVATVVNATRYAIRNDVRINDAVDASKEIDSLKGLPKNLRDDHRAKIRNLYNSTPNKNAVANSKKTEDAFDVAGQTQDKIFVEIVGKLLEIARQSASKDCNDNLTKEIEATSRISPLRPEQTRDFEKRISNCEDL